MVREGAAGEDEVLLVHRERYGDWGFPKGKALPDESDEACALREVEEETNLRCNLGPEVGRSRYRDRRGRRKVVRLYLMRPLGGEARAANEIDAVSWEAVEQALERLTYERDRAVLRSLRVTNLSG